MPCLSYDSLVGLANRLKHFYGGYVYLVGSALWKKEPRDIDIRLILPDEQFEILIGNVNSWIYQIETGQWKEECYKWSKMCTQETHYFWHETGLNIDFQIYPESFSRKRYGHLPKLLLV